MTGPVARLADRAREGVAEPRSSKRALSPEAKDTAVPSALSQLSVVLAVVQALAVPSPFQTRLRGAPREETRISIDWVQESPWESVTVNSKRARPAVLSVGVKVTARPPAPDWTAVPPTTLASVKVGERVLKPRV